MPQDTHLPTVLTHSLCGWPPPGPNGFRWLGDRLRYIHPNSNSVALDFSSWERSAVPSPVDWEAFWAECDRLDVWGLPADFSKPWIFDGLMVTTTIEHVGRAIRVVGQCADEPPELVERVEGLHAALQRLVGYQPALRK